MLCHLALGILVDVDVVVIKIVPCEGNHEPWRRRVRTVVRRRRRSCRRRGRVHGESPLPPEGDAGTVLVEDVQADEEVHPLCQAIPFQDGERGTGQGDHAVTSLRRFAQDEGGTSGGETAQDAARTDAGGPSRVAPVQQVEQSGPLGRLGGQDGDLGAGIDEGLEGGRWVGVVPIMVLVVMVVMVSLVDAGRIATPGVMVVRANGDTAGNS